MKKIMMLAAMAMLTLTAFAQFRVEAGYMTAKYELDGDGIDVTSDAFTSLKLGAYYMINDIAIEKSVLEAGVTFGMGSLKENGVKMKYSNIAVPINAGYKIEITDEFSVRPYVGINLKFNTSYKEEDYDFFDDDDAKRFQFGGQLGGLVQWKQFTAGVQYQSDFSSLHKDYDFKTKNTAITVGMIF